LGPDYLCDPRLSRVPLPLLKRFIESTGDIPSKAEEQLKEAQTKFAVISLVEQYGINLDDFLGAVVGPIDSVPAEEAISAPDKATGLVVGTAAEDEELEQVGKQHAGEISALLEGDKKRREEQAKRDAELAKAKEAKEEKARKVEEDFRAGLRAEREAKEQAARDKIAAEVHLIEMMDKLRGLSGQEIVRQVEEVGHEASTIAIYLGIDIDALKDCIDACKKINPNADELKPYEEIEKRARREHARMAALEKVQKLVDTTDPFKIGVMEVRKALAEALAAEVPPPALEDCEKKMHWAEAAQANKNILDVVEAIKEPQTMKTVNTNQLRGLLNTVAKKPEAAEAFEKLQAQLIQVELVQSHMAALEALSAGAVLKVKTAQLRIGLDGATADNVPEVLLTKFRDRFSEAFESQKVLERHHQLEADLKAAREEGNEDREREIKKELEGVLFTINLLDDPAV